MFLLHFVIILFSAVVKYDFNEIIFPQMCAPFSHFSLVPTILSKVSNEVYFICNGKETILVTQ